MENHCEQGADSSALSFFDFFLQQFVDHLRVCLAFCRFHHLADQEPERFFLAVFVILDGFFVLVHPWFAVVPHFPSSEIWTRPSRLTYSSGSPPFSTRWAKTFFAIFEEIVPF